jgi:cell division protein FtsQ
MKVFLPFKRRFRHRELTAFGQKRSVRVAARGSAVALLGLTILHGLIAGGHLDYAGSPFMKIPGKLAGLVGLAADDIRISGLVHQAPENVLATLGVHPGSSLLGFDAETAKQTLENLDWVASASVQRRFPNQLEIVISERAPFAVWQRAGNYYVIDRGGVAISSVSPQELPNLPLVTGEGAQTEVEGLVNQLAATPDISLKMGAAARVGQRRWNLYLDNGVVVLLPAGDIAKALVRLQGLDQSQQLLSKGIRTVDLRFADRVIVGIAEVPADSEAKPGIKVSANN